MRKTFFLLLLLYCALIAQEEEKVYYLKQTSSDISIDGEIESAWYEADSISDYIMFLPYCGKEPTRRTVGRLLSDDHSLYVLIVAYEQRENIQTMTGNLDDRGGDFVSVMLDTYGDNRTGYKFGVTASGVRSDSRMLDDGRNRDYSWNGVWYSDAKIYDWGFVVEIEIPYKSIQYDKSLTEWGLDLDRWIPSRGEDIYWNKYDENEGQRISKFGRLIFDNFRPDVQGLNLEIYPVALSKAKLLYDNKYQNVPEAGLNINYNPSPQLLLQATVLPDFAQIESDPYNFNISRYETYYTEKRPFFTEASEIITPAGAEMNNSFYQPLELFYSRRIGRILPDGSQVPLLAGTRISGRLGKWEYGSFFALTDDYIYSAENKEFKEQQALFSAVRIKRQIFENSSIGLLVVNKHQEDHDYSVIDIDGAFRKSNWQLAYQIARSVKDDVQDMAGSLGFTLFADNWAAILTARVIGKEFHVNEIGYVPWVGTTNIKALTGPRWYFDEGFLRNLTILGGTTFNYEKADGYYDRGSDLKIMLDFRDNWELEYNLSSGIAKDLDVTFTYLNTNISAFVYTSPLWTLALNSGYSKSFNFIRKYLSFFYWVSSNFAWHVSDILQIGTALNYYVEGDENFNIGEITYNTRPFVSLTPINDLNLRLYFDNTFHSTTERLDEFIFGLLFSYQFMPKSWLYFAFNEFERYTDPVEARAPGIMGLQAMERAAVFKIKYLYYF